MEYLDVVDENNNLTGKTEERNIIHEKGIWHREVAVWIMNKVKFYYKKELLLKNKNLINGQFVQDILMQEKQ